MFFPVRDLLFFAKHRSAPCIPAACRPGELLAEPAGRPGHTIPLPPLFRLLSQGLLGRALRPGPWHYSSSICCFTGRGKPQNPNVPVAAAAAQQGWRGGVVAPLRAESPARPAPFAPSLVKVLEQPQVALKNPPRGEVLRNFSFPTCFLGQIITKIGVAGPTGPQAKNRNFRIIWVMHACPSWAFQEKSPKKRTFCPSSQRPAGNLFSVRSSTTSPIPTGGGGLPVHL